MYALVGAGGGGGAADVTGAQLQVSHLEWLPVNESADGFEVGRRMPRTPNTAWAMRTAKCKTLDLFNFL